MTLQSALKLRYVIPQLLHFVHRRDGTFAAAATDLNACIIYTRLLCKCIFLVDYPVFVSP
jgi:hypothetical protein